MSFLSNENGAVNRRQVSQLSNDEWRAALQQQIEEKKQREQQQKRYRGYQDDENAVQPRGGGSGNSVSKQQQTHLDRQCDPQESKAHYDAEIPGLDNNNDYNGSEACYDEDATSYNPQPNACMRSGRRNVQQVSNNEWREALEQQIREKKQKELQHKQQLDKEFDGSNMRRRSQSAHGQTQDGSLFPEPQDQERGMTTPSMALGSAGAGRKRVGMQSQEEHLKSIQDQLEVKKKFEQEALEYKKALRQQRRRAFEEDDVVPEGRDAAVKELEPIEASTETTEPRGGAGTESAISEDRSALESAGGSEEKRAFGRSQAAAADPAALAKIVDFCEELKRQNEEVKKQLVEQHTVLASLRSSLVVTPQCSTAGAKSSPGPSATTRSAKGKAAPSASIKKLRGGAAHPASQKSAISKKEEGEDAERGSAGDSTSSANASVAAASRPHLVRARPVRGESKIPFPSNVTAAAIPLASVSADSKTTPVAEPKDDGEQLHTKSTESMSSSSIAAAAKTLEDADSLDEDKQSETTTTRAHSRAAAKSVSDEEEDDLQSDAKADGEEKDAKPHRHIDSENDQADDDDADDEELHIVHTSSYLEQDGFESHHIEDEDELPLGGNSKLVRCEARLEGDEDDADDEEKGEIKSCSSFVLLDHGSSSLVSLDRSLGDIFNR